MKARELFNRRVPVTEQAFAELVLWELPEPLSGSQHRYKYRLAFVVTGVCVLRYDNEAGKGDHKHVRGKEVKYRFVEVDKLVADIDRDRRVATPYHSRPSGESRREGADKLAVTFVTRRSSGIMSASKT